MLQKIVSAATVAFVTIEINEHISTVDYTRTSSNTFQQQPVPVSLATFQQKTILTLTSPSTFQQQAVTMSMGTFQ